MKSNFHYFLSTYFHKNMELSAYFEAIVPGEQKNKERLTISVKRINVCRHRAIRREKPTTRVQFHIDDVKAHVCMRNLEWYLNNSKMFRYTIPTFVLQKTHEPCSKNNGNTFFNIETSHFWRCSTRNTEAERASCWFTWTEFPWLSSLGDYESKDSKIKGFKEERISKMGLCKNPCLSN